MSSSYHSSPPYTLLSFMSYFSHFLFSSHLYNPSRVIYPTLSPLFYPPLHLSASFSSPTHYLIVRSPSLRELASLLSCPSITNPRIISTYSSSLEALHYFMWAPSFFHVTSYHTHFKSLTPFLPPSFPRPLPLFLPKLLSNYLNVLLPTSAPAPTLSSIYRLLIPLSSSHRSIQFPFISTHSSLSIKSLVSSPLHPPHQLLLPSHSLLFTFHYLTCATLLPLAPIIISFYVFHNPLIPISFL